MRVELIGRPVELIDRPVELIGRPVELIGRPVELVGRPVLALPLVPVSAVPFLPRFLLHVVAEPPVVCRQLHGAPPPASCALQVLSPVAVSPALVPCVRSHPVPSVSQLVVL